MQLPNTSLQVGDETYAIIDVLAARLVAAGENYHWGELVGCAAARQEVQAILRCEYGNLIIFRR
jgi:hypothetical protein